ncbi:hypothetical protein OZX67_03765 [Bifidobacterium sp. ESL0728]|uniref:hypothetical protein n=1 Tax=Bifidobacterium sp. ESL0728 TaxID=2983220 RepID=UPI0023F96A1E|nr:hypothetical protein [Bifidobacterium sp. ESL0728]WEV59664.1 hypothetical protein OZX67_03765 [Bifidobacterium sp. ESL0728]
MALQLQVTMPENGHWSLGRLTRLRPAAKTGIVIANNDKVFRGIIDTDGNIQSFQPMTATCSVDAVYITNE